MMDREVRVRFAPSPTGPLHIGGVRTALYNYLFARKHGGKFIVRIEDTDQQRWVPGAEEYIFESLDWLGIVPDESPKSGGSFAPYRQSERRATYSDYTDKLVQSGKAYIAFDTPEEIENMKGVMEQEGAVKPQYNSLMRTRMRNSLTLPPEEVDDLIARGVPHVVRIKMPVKHDIRFKDLIRGSVVVHSSTLDDKVLLKSDGMPTYHLANVVDDHLMNISHVIRGEEWLPSAPLHVYMYECFGWEETMPEFAHLPLILKPDGKGKLSKRDSQKHGFPIFPLEWKDAESGELLLGFREEGYFPDSTLNFLAFLGWNPGDEREIFSLDDLIREFSLERITKGGARFDVEKSRWFNEQYLRMRNTAELAEFIKNYALADSMECDSEKAEKVAELMRERVTFPSELYFHAKYFFTPPEAYDEKVVRKRWSEELAPIFLDYAGKLKDQSEIDPETAKQLLSETAESHEMGMGKLMQLLRVSVTGESGGPDLMEIISLLGPKEVSYRIESAVASYKQSEE